MAVTINELRQGWRRGIEEYDRTIAYLNEGNHIHPVGQDDVQATALWLEKLRHWRAELEALLLQFPGEG